MRAPRRVTGRLPGGRAFQLVALFAAALLSLPGAARAEEVVDRFGVVRWEMPPTWTRMNALGRWMMGGLLQYFADSATSGGAGGAQPGGGAMADDTLLDVYTREGSGLLSPTVMMVLFKQTPRPPRRSDIRREASSLEASVRAALATAAAGSSPTGPRLVPDSVHVEVSETSPAFTFDAIVEEGSDRRRIVLHSVFSRIGIHLFIFEVREKYIESTRDEVAAIIGSIALQPGMEPPTGLLAEWGAAWVGALAGCLVGALVGVREWLARRRRAR